nr:Uncharacterised protein [Neisseria gonorrhoeae]
MCRQTSAQRFDDVEYQFRLFQKNCAAFVFVDGGRGAAEVQIDFVRAESDGFQCVCRHIVRIAAQKLDGAGRAGKRFVSVGDFGDIF